MAERTVAPCEVVAEVTADVDEERPQVSQPSEARKHRSSDPGTPLRAVTQRMSNVIVAQNGGAKSNRSG
jgi:hypothetical protein